MNRRILYKSQDTILYYKEYDAKILGTLEDFGES